MQRDLSNPPDAGAQKPSRRYDLDWLRVLATFVVFLFHCTRPFNASESWHVRNNQVSPAFDWLSLLVGLWWLMPLFFVLSGAATYYALRPGRVLSFRRSRVLRLAVPLMTMGWFVLSPPQVYIERITGTGYNTTPFSGSFVQFIPEYFRGIYGLGGSFALTGVHMWYVFWLFLFSLLALPLFLFLKSEHGRRLVSRLADLAEMPGMILLMGLPLCLPEVLLKPEGLGLGMREGGWFLLTLLALLIYGFVLAGDERFGRAMTRHRAAALALGVVGNLLSTGNKVPSLAGIYAPFPDQMAPILATLGTWCWLVAILGYARTGLNFANRLLAYTGEAVLPFYMLHQTVIVIVGFFVRNWRMAIGVKYLILTCVSFAIIMLLYEFIVRRNRIVRFFFGLKPRATNPR